MGNHSLLQGIFPTLGSPALQADSLPSEPLGNVFFNGNDPDVFSVHHFSRHMKSVFPMTDGNCDHLDEVFFQASTLFQFFSFKVG